jgi:predicted DNA-binding protein
MKRYDFYFPESMMKKLRQLSRKTGVSVSEMLRRMIKRYLSKEFFSECKGNTRKRA